MVFRKYAANDRTIGILALVCAAGAVSVLTGLFPCPREEIPVLTVLFAAGLVTFLAVGCFCRELIRIDETGIACLRGKRCLWFLGWSEIDSIRKAQVFRCRGYVIVPKSTPVVDLQRPVSAPDFRIQHTRALRAALEQYGATFE